jgi:F-type H+-transporting ATPase subunit alpha
VRPLELEDIARYEKEMLEYMRTRHGGVLEAIRTTGKLEEDTKKKLMAALDEFANVFVPTKRADTQAA